MPDEIKVGGGGSVTIEYNSTKYKDDGSNGGKKKVKDKDATLSKLLVNGKEVQPLNPGDIVTIETLP